MKILITGGSGFIGTRLVDELVKENHQIIIYDKVRSNKYSEFSIVGDVRNKDQLIKVSKDIDIIYNLAAEQIIFTSSVAIYGLNRGTPNENMEAQPFNEYGRTKYEAEKIFLKWQKEEKTNLQIIRPAVVFGEENRGNVFNLINQIVSGRFAMIGDGLNKKSMGYVGNIALFLASLKDSNKNLDIFNFAGKNDLSTKQILDIVIDELKITKKFLTIPYVVGIFGGFLLDIISKITGKKFPVSVVRVQKFTAETTVSTKHLFKSGFEEKYSLEDGLRNMIRYEFKN